MKTNFTWDELTVIDNILRTMPNSLEADCKEVGVKASALMKKISGMGVEILEEAESKRDLILEIKDDLANKGITTVDEIVGCYAFTNKQAKQLLKENIDKFTLKQLKAFHKEICEE